MKTRVFKKNIKHASTGVNCPCGESFTLYFNGGELDAHTCQCGRRYAMEHRRIDITVREPAKFKKAL